MITPANRQNTAQQARRRYRSEGQRRFAVAAPNLLIGIGKDRVAHLRISRTAISAVFSRDPFNAEIFLAHRERFAASIFRYVLVGSSGGVHWFPPGRVGFSERPALAVSCPHDRRIP